jgi:hypothetical protein
MPFWSTDAFILALSSPQPSCTRSTSEHHGNFQHLPPRITLIATAHVYSCTTTLMLFSTSKTLTYSKTQ